MTLQLEPTVFPSAPKEFIGILSIREQTRLSRLPRPIARYDSSPGSINLTSHQPDRKNAPLAPLEIARYHAAMRERILIRVITLIPATVMKLGQIPVCPAIIC
jgi:hypothetical protein